MPTVERARPMQEWFPKFPLAHDIRRLPPSLSLLYRQQNRRRRRPGRRRIGGKEEETSPFVAAHCPQGRFGPLFIIRAQLSSSAFAHNPPKKLSTFGLEHNFPPLLSRKFGSVLVWYGFCEKTFRRITMKVEIDQAQFLETDLSV